MVICLNFFAYRQFFFVYLIFACVCSVFFFFKLAPLMNNFILFSSTDLYEEYPDAVAMLGSLLPATPVIKAGNELGRIFIWTPCII